MEHYKKTDENAAIKNLKMGYNLHQCGYIDEAIVYYNKSIQLYPTAEAYTYLGWAYAVLGSPDIAIEYCLMALDVDPSYGSAYNDIGSYFIQIENYEEAKRYLFEALEDDKKYRSKHFSYYNLGYLYEKTGEWFEAVRYYRYGYELEPEYTPCANAYFNLQAILN